MIPKARVPLAWRNLIHDKRRFFISTAGISLAVILVFVELGFWNALLDAAVSLLRQFNGELVIVSKARHTMAVRELITIRRLAQARAIPGVQEVFPIYVENRLSLWKNPDNTNPEEPSTRPIRVVAFNPKHSALRNGEIEAQQKLLFFPNQVLMDRRSKKEYGKREANLKRELAGHAVQVVGTFSLGTDFTSDGNLVTSDRTFARLFPHRTGSGGVLNEPDLGVIQIDPGADVTVVQAALKQALPDDVDIYTLDQFVDKERQFWQQATPIGFIFTCGLIMGLIVGMVICSQILSADVQDHLREYATLKAIGYGNSYVVGVVLQEALYLSLLGFVPALLATLFLYDYLGKITGLPLFLTPGRIALVLVLAAGMSMVAGILALRKVIKADPAEVFA